MRLRFSLLQLMLLATILALGLGLHLSSQRAQDYWQDKSYFEPQSVDFSPDGKWLVMSFPSGDVELREVTPSGVRRRPCGAKWAADGPMGHPRFVANDRIAFYQSRKSLSEDGPFRPRIDYVEWDIKTNRSVELKASLPQLIDFGFIQIRRGKTTVFRNDARREFVVTSGGPEALQKHIPFPHHVRAESFALTPDGRLLMVFGQEQDFRGRRQLYVIDSKTGDIDRVLRPGSIGEGWSNQFTDPARIAISDASVVVTTEKLRSNRPAIAIRTGVDLAVEHCILHPYRRCARLQLSGDGRRLLVDGARSGGAVYDVATGHRLFGEYRKVDVAWHDSYSPQRYVLSPDGKTLAAINDLDVDLWDVDSNRRIGQAWTAWSRWGPIRRYTAAFMGLGIITGLIFRWQCRREIAGALSRLRWWGEAAVVTILFAAGVAVMLCVIPPMFAPGDHPTQLVTLARFGGLFAALLALMTAVSGKQWMPRRSDSRGRNKPDALASEKHDSLLTHDIPR